MMKCSTENFLSSPEQSIFSANYKKNAQKAFIGAVLSVSGHFCDFLKNHSPVFRKISILRNYSYIQTEPEGSPSIIIICHISKIFYSI